MSKAVDQLRSRATFLGGEACRSGKVPNPNDDSRLTLLWPRLNDAAKLELAGAWRRGYARVHRNKVLGIGEKCT